MTSEGEIVEGQTQRLRVAMVGLGYFGQFHFKAWQRIEEVDLVGVVETKKLASESLETHSKVREFSDLDALWSNEHVDVLDIATPPHTHSDLILSAMGKVGTIICQKPFCQSLEEAKAVAAKAEAAGTKLIVHENFRFQPWYRKIKALIDTGELGDIRQALFRLRPGDGDGDDAYLARQPYFREMKRFLVHETGIHLIDVFRYLFGEPHGIYADLWRNNPVIAGEDAGLLILDMDKGVRAVFDGNRTLDHRAENTRLTMGEFIVEGGDAEVRLDGVGGLHLRQKGQVDWAPIEYHFADTDFGGDCVYRFQCHVVAHLLRGDKLETRAHDYLNNIVVEEAAYASSLQKRHIDLSLG